MKDDKKLFPEYFSNFDMPLCAKEQVLIVYRACSTGKIEKKSFLNTYEEKGGCLLPAQVKNPSSYSLSTYMKVKDVRRFCSLSSKFSPPFLLAKGSTYPKYGICATTREIEIENNIPKNERKRSSHVDWWLYKNSTPWKDFKEVDFEDEYRRNDGNNKTK